MRRLVYWISWYIAPKGPPRTDLRLMYRYPRFHKKREMLFGAIYWRFR